jgi:hypothetical protein
MHRWLRLPASLLAALCATAAFAQALPPGMTMHRVQAGEPDAAGWMAAASTEGRFSVRLPLKFNDFTVAESDPKAPVLRTHVVGSRSQEGIKFSASRLVYRRGAESAQHFFARFEKGQLGTKPERVTPLQVAGKRAVDVVLKSAATVAYQRVVLLDADLLLLVIEAPRSHESTAREYVAPFFDSLSVR